MDIFSSKAELIDLIKRIFLFQEDAPMIFTRFYFWIFFALVLLIYSFHYKHRAYRNAFLFYVSLFFYYKSSGFFFILLIVSTLSDYTIGLTLHNARREIVKKLLVALSVIINLSLLCYFKYAYFFTESYNQLFESKLEVFNYLAHWSNSFSGTHFEVDKILLPVGISFFTFQTISYTVDVYKKKCQPVRNLLDFGFYVSFFPQLVSGPIVRAAEFIPQLYQKYALTKEQFGWALFLILKGLIKKMILGDYIAVNFVDRVFENPVMFSGFENLMATYGYSLQVYCDFAGYTDIAIGVALLMGFRLPDNFNSPYKALNVGEFWKRWHMSLSTWLRDYLYFPLGGSKKGSFFTYLVVPLALGAVILIPNFEWINLIIFATALLFWLVWVFYSKIKWLAIPGLLTLIGHAVYLWNNNWVGFGFISLVVILWVVILFAPKFKKTITTDINLMITMLLGGLWHGAHLKFIIWGGLNGLGLVIYKFWKKISPYENSKSIAVRVWRIFLTFNFITFTRIFFRADDMLRANGVMKQIGTNFDISIIPSVLGSYWKIFGVMIIGFVLHWIPSAWKEEGRGLFIKMPIVVKALITVIVAFLIFQMHSAELQPFIYFQF